MEEPRQSVRTYKLRRGRVSLAQQNALTVHGRQYLIGDSPHIIDGKNLFHSNSWVIEIGFGMGEATWQMAQADPSTAIVAIDLHTPGIGKLISHLAEHNLDNVRIVEGDAVEILAQRIQPNSVDAIRLYFPDPWPKKRHLKRRFIVPENLELVATRLKIGGALHIATDWLDYAINAQENLKKSAQWEIVERHPLCNPAQRPLTKFEKRGIEAGRTITDIVAVRVS